MEFVDRERTREQFVEVGLQLWVCRFRIPNNILRRWVASEATPLFTHLFEKSTYSRPTAEFRIKSWSTKQRFESTTSDTDRPPPEIPKRSISVREALSDQKHVNYDSCLHGLSEKQRVKLATFLGNGTLSFGAALERLRLWFQTPQHDNRNAVERILLVVRRRTPSFSNTFRSVEPPSAEL